MEYSDSDVYCTGNTSSVSETLGPPRYPMTATAKRSLEDRVRDYTGQTLRHDERMDYPGSSRSSESKSPFLGGHSTRGKRRDGGMMMKEREYETPHLPSTLRGDTIWETKLDQGNKFRNLVHIRAQHQLCDIHKNYTWPRLTNQEMLKIDLN